MEAWAGARAKCLSVNVSTNLCPPHGPRFHFTCSLKDLRRPHLRPLYTNQHWAGTVPRADAANAPTQKPSPPSGFAPAFSH